MLLLNTAFLLEYFARSADGMCVAVAMGIHFFTLSTLVLMLIDAANMYRSLVMVAAVAQTHFWVKCALIGWGIPAAIVTITASVSLDSYRSTDPYCIVTQSNPIPFYAAVFAPACLIIAVNTYVFLRVSIVLLRQTGNKHKTSETMVKYGFVRRVSITQVRGSMSVMIVLGVTWILGPLAIGKLTIVFTYLFAILNSLQGFLIFIFQCVLHRQVRKMVRRRIRSARGMTTDTQVYRTTIKPTSNSRPENTDNSSASHQGVHLSCTAFPKHVEDISSSQFTGTPRRTNIKCDIRPREKVTDDSFYTLRTVRNSDIKVGGGITDTDSDELKLTNRRQGDVSGEITPYVHDDNISAHEYTSHVSTAQSRVANDPPK